MCECARACSCALATDINTYIQNKSRSSARIHGISYIFLHIFFSCGLFCLCQLCAFVWLNYRHSYELCLCILFFLVHIRLCFQEQALLPPVFFQLCIFLSLSLFYLCKKTKNLNRKFKKQI